MSGPELLLLARYVPRFWGCLRALVKRAQEGTFTPERAMRVVQARKTQQRVTAMKTADPELPPIDEKNALVRRIMAIRKQATGK